MKKYILLLLSFFANVSVRAQTVADVVNGLIPQVNNLPGLVGAVCYVAGVGCMVKAALKLKEHSETKGQVKLTVPLAYFIGAGLLLIIPTLVNIGIEATGFDTGGQFKY